MPRLTDPLLKNRHTFRKFNNYAPRTETYKVLLPPILRDHVSNKKEKNKKVDCLEEMTTMMACWKENEFNPQKCSKEVEAFDKCSAIAKAAARTSKELEEKGMSSSDRGQLPSKQVNKLLSRFPQPPHRY